MKLDLSKQRTAECLARSTLSSPELLELQIQDLILEVAEQALELNQSDLQSFALVAAGNMQLLLKASDTTEKSPQVKELILEVARDVNDLDYSDLQGVALVAARKIRLLLEVEDIPQPTP